MKNIELTKGKFAIVDDEDYERLSKYNWCIQGQYAARAKSKKLGEFGGRLTIFMHRFIMGLGDKSNDRVVDHINGNPLDNRKENLRICTNRENLRNSKVHNRFGYKGVVSYRGGKYQAMIWDGKRNLHIGMFKELEEAARAYDRKAKEMLGQFARLNFED